jgi:hypothetical protein
LTIKRHVVYDSFTHNESALLLILIFRNRKEDSMATEREALSGAESLAKTRTYGKFRCHNPSCMGRITVEPGATQCKCPQCRLEYRVAWVRPDFPRIRGPVWDVNRRIAQEAVAEREVAKKTAKKEGK